MPELPEVVVTLRGVLPHIKGKQVDGVVVRDARLRWPVPDNLSELLCGQVLMTGHQRAKYMLFQFHHGHLMIHLGMSGNLRVVQEGTPPAKHDHVDIKFSGGIVLRFTDPRRFGSVLWLEGEPEQHRLLQHLGPEPFDSAFDGERLYRLSRGKTASVKQFLMDNKTVVGVGNIYANESLFLSGIRPKKAAGKISLKRYKVLSNNAKRVLKRAIEQGGTTLKDFVGNEGKPGYFKQQLFVYGRGGEPCLQCETQLKEIRLGQRSTVYCPVCQK
ncbi:MAG: bifunctional DNA-formamidopyrimidine glycosylase/DNA-(apurinic or apyrimidinic site) lyase [Porticoccus sp.]|nr:bifunctional DNA-formamidopyrimidine glycosylase/DNA-(apurinic or apyrimidinic site) lyase [Porticoccus sp.]